MEYIRQLRNNVIVNRSCLPIW